MLSLRKLPSTISRCSKSLIRCLTSEIVESTEPVEPNNSENKCVLLETNLSITTIGINHKNGVNCLDIATANKLSKALDEFENNDESVAGVLYGVGGNFCAGYDLGEIVRYAEERKEIMPEFNALTRRIGLCKKPLIAAMSGYAVGIGFELALMCDLRVVEETTLMGFLNRRFGIPILCGGTVRLPAIIGYSRAMDLILTGRLIQAEQALQWGIANQYCACGSVLGRAVSLARSIVKFPNKTLLADRASVHNATFCAKSIEEAFQFEQANAHLVLEEGVEQAKRFYTEDIGRHGKFYNLKNMDTDFKPLDENLW